MAQPFYYNGKLYIELSTNDDDADWLKRLPGHADERSSFAIARRINKEELAEEEDGSE